MRKERKLYFSSKRCAVIEKEMYFFGLLSENHDIKIRAEEAEVLRTWPKSDSTIEIQY